MVFYGYVDVSNVLVLFSPLRRRLRAAICRPKFSLHLLKSSVGQCDLTDEYGASLTFTPTCLKTLHHVPLPVAFVTKMLFDGDNIREPYCTNCQSFSNRYENTAPSRSIEQSLD